MSKLVARTQPGLNMGSPNPTRARKKMARPSPNFIYLFLLGFVQNPTYIFALCLQHAVKSKNTQNKSKVTTQCDINLNSKT